MMKVFIIKKNKYRFLALIIVIALILSGCKDNLTNHFERGREYYSKGQYEQAISEFTKAIDANVGKYDVYIYRAIAYELQGKHDQAASDIDRAIEISPNATRDYYSVIDSTLSQISEDIKSAPKNAETYYRRANVYLLKLQCDKAWADVHKAQSLGFEVPHEFLKNLRELSEDIGKLGSKELFEALGSGNQERIRELIQNEIKAGQQAYQKRVDENFKKSIFYTSGLYEAITSGNQEKVSEILDRNKNLVWEGFLETPLILAVKQKDKAMVKLLLSKEPTLAKGDRDGRGMTPLHWAVKVGDEEIAKILIDHSARINEGDIRGKTPLALAQEIGNKSMVDLLKAHGATEQDFESMILRAIQQGDYDTVKKLLKKGVDVNMRVPNGDCLIHYAAEAGHTEVAELLVEKGANIHDTGNGQTPLELAVEKGHWDLVKFFISKGANPKRKTYFNGMSLSEQARAWGHSDIADYLDSLNVTK